MKRSRNHDENDGPSSLNLTASFTQQNQNQGHCSAFFQPRKRPSSPPHNPTEADALLAKEMTALAVSERNQALEDVHGVSNAIAETPALIESKLLELEECLQKIPKKKRVSYDKAFFLNPQYCLSQSFRLRFLRADQFDAEQAAQRLVHHFDLKLELFSYEELARDITLSDLSQDDIDCLKCGTLLFLHHYDRAGRRLLLTSVEPGLYKKGIHLVSAGKLYSFGRNSAR